MGQSASYITQYAALLTSYCTQVSQRFVWTLNLFMPDGYWPNCDQTVLPIHFVSPSGLWHMFPLMKWFIRERYPLTSQLIQENKIPEFGERLFIEILSRADHPIQTTFTSTSIASSTTVSLIYFSEIDVYEINIAVSPRLASERWRRTLPIIRGTNIYFYIRLRRPSV